MPQLIVQNLTKRLKNRCIVNQASLTVESGQVVGLLGPNGAGKTTCFYMIVGLIPCDQGKVWLDQHDLTTQSMHARARLGLSYLPQEPSVFRRLTVFENVLAVLEMRRDLKAHQRVGIAETLLEELHISHLHNSFGVSLSGGERRRVEIARALATQPRFMLLDEPFAGIDPLSLTDIQRVIHHLKSRDIGILITDHNVRETLAICDHAYILNEGHVIATGDAAAILTHPTVRQVYLGDSFRL